MSYETIINDLRGWSCGEICPYHDKKGCAYSLGKEPVDCPVMIQRYAFDILTEQQDRLKPKNMAKICAK